MDCNGSNAPNTHCDDIVLKAYMHCDGCCRKVFKCLKCLEGVEDVVIDSANHRVIVKGKKADPLKALKILQKNYSRNAELISPEPMFHTEVGKEPEKKKQVEVKIVVLKMFMHCEGCVNDVKKNIERMTGILTVEPNMEASQVTVRGAFEVPKLVEDIRKRLGKHVEIVEQGVDQEQAEGCHQEGIEEGEYIFQYPPQCSMHCAHLTQMFNDENVFSCSIM